MKSDRGHHINVNIICSSVLLCRLTRKDYITAKYTEKRFAQRKYGDTSARQHALREAVKSRDILTLLQVFAEGVDLMEYIPPGQHEHVSEDCIPDTRSLQICAGDKPD